MIKMFSQLYDRYFAEEEAFIFTLLLIGVAVIMMTMGSIIAPLLWSLVITFLLQGVVNSLDRLKVPHVVSVYLVYLVFISVMVLVMVVFLPFTWNRMTRFVNELPYMVDHLRTLALLLPEHYPELFTREQVQDWITTVQGELGQVGQTILSYSVSSITRVVTWSVYTVLVPIMVFFMLKDSEKLLDWMESWLPERRPLMAKVWHEMNDQLANYIRGKALEMLIVGGVSFVVFQFMGLNYAFLLSVLTGLSVIVPFVGATVVAVPVFLVAFFQWGFTGDLYQVIIAYLVIQTLDANVLVPLIFSETVNLHPIAIITAVLVFGGLWGFWGVFFAIPLATFIKAIINAWPERPKAQVVEADGVGGKPPRP